MTLQYGVAVRNAQATCLQTTPATSSPCNLKIWAATTTPANCGAPDTGASNVTLATIPLPATFLTASAGVTTLAGSWTVAASTSGTALYFRIYDNGGTCHIQGSCVTDLVLNNTSITAGQTVTVNTFGVTVSNA
jgi:hypothetical protein